MSETAGVERIVERLAASGGDVFRAAADLTPVVSEAAPVRCVLVHAFAFGLGGLERVVALQCALFRELGLEVHLLLSSPMPAVHYPLPEGVVVHELPSARPECGDEVRARERALLEVVRKTGADVYLDSAYLNLTVRRPIVLCDWMTLKTLTGVRVVLHWHNVFSRFLRQPEGLAFARNLASTLRFCDGLIVLSRVDRRFFSAFGCRVQYLPNPVDAELVRASRAAGGGARTGKTVLWCGRLTDVKRPLEALRAFAEARATVPEAKLIMVGGGAADQLARLNRFVDAHGLRGSVTLTGELPNPYPQYDRADVFLSTSTCEGYPVSFVEAFAFSLPIVSMGKGYLELLRAGAGAVVVPEDDARAAGRALAEVLGDEGRLARMRAAASETWRELRDFDLPRAYDGFFRALGRAAADETEVGEDERRMVGEILAAVPVGVDEAFRRDRACFRQAGVLGALKALQLLSKVVSLALVGRLRRRVRGYRNACRAAIKLLEEGR